MYRTIYVNFFPKTDMLEKYKSDPIIQRKL